MQRRYRRRDVQAEGDELDEPGQGMSGDTLRKATAAILIIVLVADVLYTAATVGRTTASGTQPSAIQVSQVYIEGCFYAIAAIGVTFAIYVITKRPGR